MAKFLVHDKSSLCMQKTEHGVVGGLSEAVLAMQAVVVPFVGVMGNMVNRIRLITAGALVWAAMSVAFGLSTSYPEVCVLQLSPGCCISGPRLSHWHAHRMPVSFCSRPQGMLLTVRSR